MAGCFEVEYAEPRIEICSCCGKRIFRLTRFVTKHRDAYAICYALYTEGHQPQNVKYLISVGPWWKDDPNLCRCFTIWYVPLAESHGYDLHDPVDSPWNHLTKVGRFLTRDEALIDENLPDVWSIIDLLAKQDPVLGPYLR
jgi:hypothetical protein